MAEQRTRRYKGPRKAILIRVPEHHAALYEQLAEEAGEKSTSDYLMRVLCKAHDLPEPFYVHRRRDDPIPGMEHLAAG